MRHMLLAAALLGAFAWPADARTRRARPAATSAAAGDAIPGQASARRTGGAAASAACTQASPCTGPRGGRYYLSGTRKTYLAR